MTTLRPYQEQAIAHLAQRLRTGARRPILVAPTGAGKGEIIAAMVRGCVAKGFRALVIAHRKELIEDLHKRVSVKWGCRASVIMGKHKLADDAAPVQIGSIQSLVHREPLSPRPQLIIIDECHHAVRGSGYETVLDMYPGVVTCGTSATPFRADGKPLDLFDAIEIATTPKLLIDQGYLVEPIVFGDVEPDLKGLKTRGGDWAEEELAARVMTGVKDVVSAWEKHAAGPMFAPRTLVFGVTIEHSKALAQAFRDRGHRAEHVDGTTPKVEREAIFARLESGATRVVCNVGIATEGFDCPAVECVVLARPTQSLCLFIQMVGRGLRPFTGKKHALIIDCGGNVVRLGWPTRDLSSEYTLTGPLPSADWKKKESSGVRRCKGCFAVFESSKGWPCPMCGWRPTIPARRETGRDVRQLREEEVKVPTVGEAKATWDGIVHKYRWKRKADGTPYKPGFYSVVYLKITGRQPRPEWVAELQREG